MTEDPHRVENLSELKDLYGTPNPNSLVKERDRLTDHYRAFVAAAPFVVLATSGPNGLDCSPRGDPPGFVAVEDDRTLLLPDRRGNNRIDSLRNIISDPRVALFFLIPGKGETLRVSGDAEIRTDPDLLARFETSGKLPRSVLRIRIRRVYFQCQKALARSKLWQPDHWADPSALPSAGQILGALTAGGVDGEAYDAEYPARMQREIY